MDPLSSCFNLEWLALKNCTLPHNVQISGLFSLEFLSIINCPEVKTIDISACELAGMQVKAVVFSCVPKLKSVHFPSPIQKLDEEYVVSSLSKHLPQIEMLTIYVNNPNAELYVPTTFSNIVQLNLFVCLEETHYEFAWTVIPLLRAFPLLQKLFFRLPPSSMYTYMNMYGQRKESNVMKIPSPEQLKYSVKHLRVVYFSGFHGTKKQMETVVSVLENSAALELMILDTSHVACVNGTWRSEVNFKNVSFKSVEEDTHSRLQGKSISQKAKLVIKPAVWLVFFQGLYSSNLMS